MTVDSFFENLLIVTYINSVTHGQFYMIHEIGRAS